MARRDVSYRVDALMPSDAATLGGLVLLDFGTDWCGHCVAARAAVDAWLAGRDAIDHWRIEDGSGRALGRAFRVKLWPTLILLRDGAEVARVVRPREAGDLQPLAAAAE
jgi:thioredoxin 1